MFKKNKQCQSIFPSQSIPWVLLVENAVFVWKCLKEFILLVKVFFQFIKMFTTWTKSFCVCLTSYPWEWVSEWMTESRDFIWRLGCYAVWVRARDHCVVWKTRHHKVTLELLFNVFCLLGSEMRWWFDVQTTRTHKKHIQQTPFKCPHQIKRISWILNTKPNLNPKTKPFNRETKP